MFTSRRVVVVVVHGYFLTILLYIGLLVIHYISNLPSDSKYLKSLYLYHVQSPRTLTITTDYGGTDTYLHRVQSILHDSQSLPRTDILLRCRTFSARLLGSRRLVVCIIPSSSYCGNVKCCWRRHFVIYQRRFDIDDAAEIERNPVSKHEIQPEYGEEQAEAIRDCQTRLARPILRRERRQGAIHSPCSADHEQY